MKAKVTLKEGLRYYRIDGSFRDAKYGDVLDTEDIPPFSLEERLRDKHLVPVAAKATPAPAPTPAPEPPAPTVAAAKGAKK